MLTRTNLNPEAPEPRKPATRRWLILFLLAALVFGLDMNMVRSDSAASTVRVTVHRAPIQVAPMPVMPQIMEKVSR